MYFTNSMNVKIKCFQLVQLLQVEEMYKSIVDQMKYYERSKLINWTNKAKLLSVQQMESNILVCVKTNDNISK